MKNVLIILGSSVVVPPNHHHHHHHHHHYHSHSHSAKSKPSLTPSTTTTATAKLSHSKPPSTTRPLLSTVRWDSAAPRGLRNHQLRYHADLASKLAQDGRFEDFAMITESVVASGIEPSDFAAMLKIELVSAGIVGVLGEGRVWDVVEVLCRAEKLGIVALKLFDLPATMAIGQECRRIAKCGELEECVKLIETLSGFGFSAKELVEPSEIVGLCVRKRNSNLAIRYACILPHAHIEFCTIIREFGNKGDLVSALTVFDASKKKSSSPNMYAYRTIIDVCGLCGDYLQSRSIYEGLIAEKITPNIYVFNSLMNANAGDLAYTMHVYKHMQDVGVPLDVTSYNILMKSCCLAARVDLAQDIYREVQQLESKGILKLDLFTYSTIIKVFADAKMLQMALKIKEDMLSAGITPNTVTWSSLISACANVGFVEQAVQLFDDMLLAGCEPNSQCCNVLLHACVEACQYDRAFRLFRTWKENGFYKALDEDYNVNISSNVGVEHAHANSGNTVSNCTVNSHKLKLHRRIPFTPTTATYNILMKACGTDYYRAKALMEEMSTAGLSPNYISWSTLIHVCGCSGKVESAVQILNSMHEAGIEPDAIAYTTAIKICVQRKHLKTAFSLFAEMKRYQIKPKFVTYNTLLKARSRYGSLQEVQQCLEIYQDMCKAGYKSNDYYLMQLIEEWCEGVIQNDNQNGGKLSYCEESGLGGPRSFLLEKVAAHLLKRNAERLTIDVRDLTKVEARIVVLAVLRMIKENNAEGCSLKDDLLIILGVGRAGTTTTNDKYEVEGAITKLLRNELGLEVSLARSKAINLAASLNSYSNVGESDKFPMQSESFVRKPAVFLRSLKVTRKSLNYWLRKHRSIIKEILLNI